MGVFIMGAPQPEEQQLPANRDRGGDLPLKDNPFTDENPSNEGLIGLYPYSGADIKLVIHMPPEDPRASDDRLKEVEDELAEYTRRAESGEDHGEQSLAEINSTIETLTRQLEALREDGANGPTTRTKVLGEISTLSLSVHREKHPVRTLGSVYPRSFTRGGRTIGGSAVFTTFHQHVLYEFLEVAQYRSTGVGDFDRFRWTSHVIDQLPPLDISITFANEYGNLSWMSILGVEFLNEGMVMSIEDLFVESTAQYVARDFDPLRNVANRQISRTNGVGQSLSGTSIMMEDLRRRQVYRNDPWI
jgi:hypothetical protein